MESQKTKNCQSKYEEKEQSWRHNPHRLQTILQSYSNQNSMVLAQKQTYGSMEQNREPRNKPTHLWSINLQQRRQEYKMEKRQSLQQVVLGKLDSCMEINEVRTLPQTIHKSSKWIKDFNIRHDTIQLPEENIGKTFSDLNRTNVFISQYPKAIEIKAKINK